MICKKYPYAFQYSTTPTIPMHVILHVCRITRSPANFHDPHELLAHATVIQSNGKQHPPGQCDEFFINQTWRMKFYKTLEDLLEDNLGIIL